MPLHADGEWVVWDLDAFDDVIWSPGDNPYVVPWTIHCLVMEGVHTGDLVSHCDSESRSGLKSYRVHGWRRRNLLCSVADLCSASIRNVLEQSPPQRDVHHLDAPADCQEWQALLHGCAHQCDLVPVSLGVDAARLGVEGLSVEARVHVSTAT